MFTKNFYYGLSAQLHRGVSPTTDMYPNIKNLSGTLPTTVNAIAEWPYYLGINANGYYYPTVYIMRTSLTTHGGVIIGTGTTPPTMDDYCLSGDMITTFSYSVNVSVATDSDGMTMTAVYSITNTGSEPFTIGEIGLMASSYGTKTAEQYKCLVERTVLDSPVTIPAGGVGQVTYTIRMNYPT